MSPLVSVGIAFGIYVVVVLAVGLWATRRSGSSPEEYFLAGRGLGTLVLFMALFGTNCTPFLLVGIPGKAYHAGVGTFGLNAPIIALGIPLTFWAIGSPARRMGVRLNAMTPAELFAKRFDSRVLGLVLFGFFTLYTLPYMVIGIKGAAVTLAGVSDGAIPQWLGGLVVLLVALIYTLLGGMRATAWTNVLQGTLFMLFMVTSFFLMSSSLGGLAKATETVKETVASHLVLGTGGLFSPAAWTSWGLAISLTVIAFPHMLVRLMAAKGEGALKGACRLYPPALVALWLPAVMIGVWGAAAFPGLVGRESDKIFSLMVSNHLPAGFAVLGFLAVLAAVMSTLDAQILTLSSMLVRDVIEPFSTSGQARDDVRSARIFSVVLAGFVYLASQLMGKSVFDVAAIAFSGYVTLVPTLFFGVRWRRFTVSGAISSVFMGNMVLGLGLLGWIPLGGFLPIFWALFAGVLTALFVSFLTKPARAELTSVAFGDEA